MLIHSSTSNLAVVLQADNYLSTVEISADFVSKTVEGERQGRDQGRACAVISRHSPLRRTFSPVPDMLAQETGKEAMGDIVGRA